MNGLDLYKPKPYYSPSGLCNAAKCLRSYFLSSGCRLCSSTPIHVSATFGSCLHKALPIARTLGPAESIQVFEKAWNAENGPARADDKRNLARAEQILSDFSLREKPYKLLKAPSSRLTGTDLGDYEIPFAIDIGLDRPLAGKIDGWCEHLVTQEPWGLEYKTTSGLGSYFLDAFRRSPQFASYSLALREMTKGDIKGMMLEGILVAKTKENNLCQPITIVDSEIDEFIAWAGRLAGIINKCEYDGFWPQNFAACNAYPWFWRASGNCAFLDLCQAGDSWQDLLESLFEIRQDDPLWIKKGA